MNKSRERLDKFKSQLREKGCEVLTNWQIKKDHIELDHCQINGNNGFIMVIFQIYPDGNGFEVYIQSLGNDYDTTIKAITDLIN